MLFAIPDILLKGTLNTNKNGHHVVRYNWHAIEGWPIFESGVKHQ